MTEEAKWFVKKECKGLVIKIANNKIALVNNCEEDKTYMITEERFEQALMDYMNNSKQTENEQTNQAYICEITNDDWCKNIKFGETEKERMQERKEKGV